MQVFPSLNVLMCPVWLSCAVHLHNSGCPADFTALHSPIQELTLCLTKTGKKFSELMIQTTQNAATLFCGMDLLFPLNEGTDFCEATVKIVLS